MEVENYQENKLRILGKLTANLIHEIRNPLSAIKLNLDYLQMAPNEFPEDVRESIKGCNDAMIRIQSLLDNLSAFNRINSRVNTCSINEVTHDTVNIMNSSARTGNVVVTTCLDDKLPKISFDRNKLLQVFLNLVTNAIEACENGGNVIIKSYLSSNSEIIWEISDDGIGISPEDRCHILNDFYTSKSRGTGLGLSICQAILMDNKCELDFESEVGKGTTFCVIINPILLQSSL